MSKHSLHVQFVTPKLAQVGRGEQEVSFSIVMFLQSGASSSSSCSVNEPLILMVFVLCSFTALEPTIPLNSLNLTGRKLKVSHKIILFVLNTSFSAQILLSRPLVYSELFRSLPQLS